MTNEREEYIAMLNYCFDSPYRRWKALEEFDRKAKKKSSRKGASQETSK